MPNVIRIAAPTVSLTIGRGVFTVIGANLAAARAWGMALWDEHTGLMNPGIPT